MQPTTKSYKQKYGYLLYIEYHYQIATLSS